MLGRSAFGSLFVLAFLAGCGSGGSSGFGDGGTGGDGGTLDDAGDPVFPDLDGGTDVMPPCTGIKCQQVNCGGGASTTVSGTVYMPNGTLPLYNAIVYVPNTPLDPISNGATCDKCGSTVSGSPIVTTLTDHQGKFILKDVPVGTQIPLVVQVGKWRRQFVLPQVSQCVDNPVSASTLRLPKNRNEGDMPKIAVTTGGCDPLACILPKIGIDATEYGVSSAAPTKVTMYAGSGGSGPPGITSATNLWGNATELKKFDLAIFSCECSENNGNKTNPQAVQQYVDGGGRLFTSHYHYTWFKNLIPAWTPTASWQGAFGNPPDLIDTSFPKGKALADWLKYVEPSLTYGEMPLNEKTYNAGAVNPPTTRWVYSTNGGATTHYLSFNTPVGAMPDNQCGKAVYGGMHISAGGGSVSTNFPTGCTTTLSPQEKALAFLLFDLSSCIQKDTDPPKPPDPK